MASSLFRVGRGEPDREEVMMGGSSSYKNRGLSVPQCGISICDSVENGSGYNRHIVSEELTLQGC